MTKTTNILDISMSYITTERVDEYTLVVREYDIEKLRVTSNNEEFLKYSLVNYLTYKGDDDDRNN